MILNSKISNDRSKDQGHTFIDGDILVMVLPTVVDLGLYTRLKRELDEHDDHSIQQILLDCSAVEKLCASGVAAFIGLGRLTLEQRVRLLILDPPVGISHQLDPILPNATWIDSYQESGVHMMPTGMVA